MGVFEKIKGNFGFGFMRLPMDGDRVDENRTREMVDLFMEQGFNYFDTAHGYLDGQSEQMLKTCLTSRYPRESYVLADKLSPSFFHKQEDIIPLFEKQLEACGVEYFDFYLMHAQSKKLFAKYKACKAYETALQLREQGRIRHLGISFHDTAEVLDQILTEYPQIEVVQIQLNYVDFEDPAVQSRKCLEVCRKHGKPVIVMEPVKGGTLVNLSGAAKAVLDRVGSGSYASYAVRFAAMQPGVFMVLSGMSSPDMVADNTGYMRSFEPLNEEELEAVERVCAIVRDGDTVACTACRYCVEVCPQKISIPDIFACYNNSKIFNDWNAGYYYSIHTDTHKVSDCLQCGKCEQACPQHLEIRTLLQSVDAAFEEKKE